MREHPSHNVEGETEPPVYVPKNGLSALIMLALWKSRGGLEPFECFVGQDPRHRADVLRIVNSATQARVISSFDDLSPGRHVVHTTSLERDARDFISRREWLGHTIVEHGTAECWRFVDACRGKFDWPGERFLTFFHDRLSQYLRDHDLDAVSATASVPMAELRDLVTELSSLKASYESEASLFIMQPLADRGSLAADALPEVIDSFLARRRPVHYRIKDHPHAGPKTISILTNRLNARGLSFDVLPSDEFMIELSFPGFGCSEISTFYSTAAITCAELYGVGYDTMIDEIKPHIESMSKGQRQMFPFVSDFFGSNPR